MISGADASPLLPAPLTLPMRDGARLVADRYLPAETDPVPAVLLRTPYDRSLFPVEAAPLAAAGYAVVVQSVRGRYGSEGDFRPYLDEGPDGYDSVQQVAGQPWCDGRVAMIGASYSGWTSWAAARERPPALRTFVSTACCASWTGEWPWVDGVLWPGAITWLHLYQGAGEVDLSGCDLDAPPWPLSAFQDRYPHPLEQAQEWLRHPRPDPYWAPLTLRPSDFAGIDLPVLHVTGWFDGCQRSAHLLYEQMRRHSPAADRQQLVVGAWDHTIRDMQRSYDGVDFGEQAVIDYHALRVQWFGRTLRGSGGPLEAPVRAFLTGADRWLDLPDLPVPDAGEQRWWLGSDGRLSDAPAEPGCRTFRYDPRDPVPTRPADRPASYPELERSRVHAREDVLTWESAPLQQPVVLAGRARLDAWIETDVEDTDVFVELVDVGPDGRRLLVAHGRRRARYRADQPVGEPLVPGQRACVPVELAPRVHRFASGHRIVAAVTSSGAPLWAPHPNRGGDLWDAAEPVVATTGVHADSALTLPVIADPTP